MQHILCHLSQYKEIINDSQDPSSACSGGASLRHGRMCTSERHHAYCAGTTSEIFRAIPVPSTPLSIPDT